MLNAIKKYYLWAVLIVAIAAQLYFPIHSIVENNDILETGAEYKINIVRPLDPTDPFRGRYVSIFVSITIPNELKDEIPDSGPYYIRLITGEDGFAELSEVSITPLEGEGVLKLDNPSQSWLEWGNMIQLPFDRYYMREEIAPKAENAYRRQDSVYVKLKVKNRKGIIAGLYVDDMRIEDYARQ